MNVKAVEFDLEKTYFNGHNSETPHDLCIVNLKCNNAVKKKKSVEIKGHHSHSICLLKTTI